jgi:hypothetical protein
VHALTEQQVRRSFLNGSQGEAKGHRDVQPDHGDVPPLPDRAVR